MMLSSRSWSLAGALLVTGILGCEPPTAADEFVEVTVQSVPPTFEVPAVEIRVTNVSSTAVEVLRCGTLLVMTGELRRTGEAPLVVNRGQPCPPPFTLGTVPLAPGAFHADTVAMALSGEWRWKARIDGRDVPVPSFVIP